MGLSGKYVNTL